MRRTLSVLLLIVLLNVASATQNQYNNPPQYVQRPSDGGDYPNGEPSATQRQMQQTEAQFAAPIPQQPAVYGMQQPMQPYGAMQQQQQRPPPGYQSPYGRQPLQQQENTNIGVGLFSKLKSSLFAAGTAISESLATSTFDGTVVAPSQGSQQQGYYGNNRAGPGAGGGAMYGQQQQQQQRYPPAGTGAGTGGGAAAGNSGSYGYDSRGRPIQQHMRAADEDGAGPGIFGRIKSFLGVEGLTGTDDTAGAHQRQQQQQLGYPSPSSSSEYGPGGRMSGGLPPHLIQQQQHRQQQHNQQQLYPSPPGYTTSSVGSAAAADGYPVDTSAGAGYSPFGDSRYMPAPPSAPARSVEDADFPDMPPLQTQHQQLLMEGEDIQQQQYGSFNAQDISASVDDRQGTGAMYSAQPPLYQPEEITQAAPPVAPEPQMFTHADSVVMILRPKEFYRKKALISGAGAENVQVFSDFEHVMTAFNTNSQGAHQSGTSTGASAGAGTKERALSSAELLETSGAVSAEAVAKINNAAEQLEGSAEPESDDFESVTAKVQAILAKEGNVHISSVAPVVRNMLPKLGLRLGWKEALQSLTVRGVPTYLFSSGYGDVVSQVILQALYPGSGASAGSSGRSMPLPGMAPHQQQQAVSTQQTQLPQNLRIISNFFRTAPDGTVRAFSQPIVHERNKNATTAAISMGFPVLNRPYAIVLGSHEDDVLMTQGVADLQEQLSVGYLELSEDLAQRLPLYLSTYDAVVVGDGSFEYVRSLLDDILQLPHSPLGGSGGGAAGEVGSAGAGGAIGNAVFGRGTVSGAVSGVGGVAMGLRSRLGQLLNPTTAANPSTQPQQQQVYPQHQYQQYQQGRQLLPPPPSAGFPPQYNPAQPSPPPHQPQYHPPTAGATAGGAGAYPPSPSSPQQPSQQRTYQGNVQGISEYDAPQRAPGAQQGEQKTFMDFTTEY